jgi:hypothetical protein
MLCTGVVGILSVDSATVLVCLYCCVKSSYRDTLLRKLANMVPLRHYHCCLYTLYCRLLLLLRTYTLVRADTVSLLLLQSAMHHSKHRSSLSLLLLRPRAKALLLLRYVVKLVSVLTVVCSMLPLRQQYVSTVNTVSTCILLLIMYFRASW